MRGLVKLNLLYCTNVNQKLGNQLRYNQNVLDDMIEAAVQALLGFSQIECVRPFFCLPLPLQDTNMHSDQENQDGRVKRTNEKENKSGSKAGNVHNSSGSSSDSDIECSVTAVHVVLSVIRSRPNIAANCLGVLMNACLDPPLSSSPSSSSSSSSSSSPISATGGQVPILGSNIKDILVRAGGVELGTTGITLTSKERLNFFEKECPQGELKESTQYSSNRFPNIFVSS